MKPVCDQALPSGSGGDTADQMQKMMCAANIRKNHAYVKARSLIAALYSLHSARSFGNMYKPLGHLHELMQVCET